MVSIIEAMHHALAVEERRTQGHIAWLAKRTEQGLPSWDVFLTMQQWLASKEEGLSMGCIKHYGDHYQMHVDGFSPARIMIVGPIGEKVINPAEDTMAHTVGVGG